MSNRIVETEEDDVNSMSNQVEEWEIYKDVWMIEHHMNPIYKRVWKMNGKLYTKDGFLRELK